MQGTLLRVIAATMATARTAYASIRSTPSIQPVSGSSAPALAALLADWNAIAFDTPSKPAQYRVFGRNGHVTDGPTYNTMVTLIRLALKESREGRDQEALEKVAKVRGLLEPR